MEAVQQKLIFTSLTKILDYILKLLMVNTLRLAYLSFLIKTANRYTCKKVQNRYEQCSAFDVITH